MSATGASSSAPALVAWFYFASGEAQDDGYQAAERVAQYVRSVLGTEHAISPSEPHESVRLHLVDPEQGHELIWRGAHEAEVVYAGVGRTPDKRAAREIWKDAYERIWPALEQCAGGETGQGSVVALVGVGPDEELIPIAETLLGVRMTLTATAAWGSVRAPGPGGPYVVVAHDGCQEEGAAFAGWDLFGYALYAYTKGRLQWHDFDEQRVRMERLVAHAMNSAYDAAVADTKEHSHAHSVQQLEGVLNASRVVGYALERVVKASVNIGKARTNIQRTFRGVFAGSRVLAQAPADDLHELESILEAEAVLLRERSAELDRIAQQWQRRRHIETSRRTEGLLEAAHLVEFFVVLYYSLAAWSIVAGKAATSGIPWPWKLAWGLLLSAGAVFATHCFVMKGQHLRAFAVGLVVLVAAVAAAAGMHWIWPA